MNMKLARENGYYLDCILVKDPLEIKVIVGPGFIEHNEEQRFSVREENQIIKIYALNSQNQEKIEQCRDLSTYMKQGRIIDMYKYFQALQKEFVESISNEYNIQPVYITMKEV